MSQEISILQHLQSGQTITSLDALKMFGCFRCASRINELRREGYNIETRMIESNGKRFAEYFIPTEITLIAIPVGKQAQYSFAV